MKGIKRKRGRGHSAHAANNAIGNKIRVLRHENVPEKQAVAMALNMKREGRLGPHGEYRRKKRHGRRG